MLIRKHIIVCVVDARTHIYLQVKELEAENAMLSTDLEASETKYDDVKDELDALTKELEDM